MNVEVDHNFNLREVTAPASKSYAQRAIMAASLGSGTSTIRNIGSSDDVQNILNVAKQLGAEIKKTTDGVTIAARMNPVNTELNCGESGLGVRLTTPIAGTFGEHFKISGTGSLLKRPMEQFETFLPQLGVEVHTIHGKLPLTIDGRLQGGEIHLDGSLSSQFLSGLMMALPLAEKDSVIHIQNLVSKPYVKMTLEIMRLFGIDVTNNYDLSKIEVPGRQSYQPCDYSVEGDWSGASFWAVYGAIKGNFQLKGLNPRSNQADIAILKAIVAAGGSFEWINETVIIHKTPLQSFNFDATNCPDLFPPLVVLAAATNGTSLIGGVSRLKHKESDRAAVLKKEFNKLGLSVEIEGDIMRIESTGELSSGTIESHNDHRIAMAGAIAAVLTPGINKIAQAEAVNKSYPEFWDTLKGSNS
ncbi:MAG: 3-phosphoshikimate 1-carboxyvinyltransferase [Crocinitomicaceae bacterium]|nr:3-phosphoshikimate 1-carboxyvinyltransferase [Crocinitomicaceae bacterium]